MAKNFVISEVPCNGCTLCCQGDAIRLLPEDNPKDYITEPHPYLPGALMLAHKLNGECIYLSESCCVIHDHAPSLCRAADCRSLAAQFDFDTARELHLQRKIDLRVWDRGNFLLEEMAKQIRDEKNSPNRKN